MKLQSYRKTPEAKSLRQIAKDSGVSYQTVKQVAGGKRMQNYSKAKSISDATDGAVTIDDLCEK